MMSLYTMSAPFASVLIAGMVCATLLHILKCHPKWPQNLLAFCQKRGVKLAVGGMSFSVGGAEMAESDTLSDAPEKTVEDLTKAAKGGDTKAQNSLGLAYAKGEGMPQDYGQAASWWQKAAKRENADAQYNLGVMYSNGHGVPQDYAQAVTWYRKAAAQGHARAQHNLGVMYYNGHGVPQDDAQAVTWYRKAAAQGHARAQHNLGVMYYNGHGVPQDYGQAYAWSSLAAAGGSKDVAKDAAENRDQAAEMLDTQGMREAQALSRTLVKNKDEDGE